MSKYLSETYEVMGQGLVVDESYFKNDSRFYSLEQILLSLPAGRVLDMGCGQGMLLERVKAHHSVFGLEYDEGAADVARSRGIPVERIDLNEAERLPFDFLFDGIVCSEVCEHLLAPRNAFRLARRQLSENGIFVVTVPNAVPLFARCAVAVGASCDWLHYPSQDTEQTGHIRFYTLDSLSRLAVEEGFVVVERRGLGWRMNGKFWARLCYWAARLSCASDPVKRAMLLDRNLARLFPRLSPGLMLVLKKA